MSLVERTGLGVPAFGIVAFGNVTGKDGDGEVLRTGQQQIGRLPEVEVGTAVLVLQWYATSEDAYC